MSFKKGVLAMAETLIKLLYAALGRDTPAQAAKKSDFYKAVEGAKQSSENIAKTVEETRVWVEEQKAKCTERRAAKKARDESNRQEIAHG